jgi:hypothetical protein
MDEFVILAAFGLAAFLVAWVVNGLVGMMSGEKPGDTGRLWLDVFLRMFGVLELGLIGRVLNYIGLKGRPRKVCLFVGLLCLLLFLVKGRHEDTHARQIEHVRSYPTRAP